MGQPLLAAILALLVWLPASAALAGPAPSPLEARLAEWPAWSRPAPLRRPGRRDLTYPGWFAGEWLVESSDGLRYTVRFQRRADGAVVGERAFNAAAAGRAALGDTLLRVSGDPSTPNRQIALLEGDQQLESTVTGRRSERTADGLFLADERSLQVLHRPGPPRLSEVETLSRYELQPDGSIRALQWQVRFDPPGGGPGFSRTVLGSSRLSLRLLPQPQAQAGPGADRAS
jgi:hypothetical protein